MKQALSKLLFLLFFFLMNGQHLQAQTFETKEEKDARAYYVLAPSGLKLRSAADVKSSAITTIPYGAKVELLVPTSQRNMLVDNYPGGMAKVKYGDQTGYTFDGYLCRMPVRTPAFDNLKAYMDWARGKRANVLYESCSKDYDGYYQDEEVIIPFINDWAEAFLLTKTLLDIPFDYPADSSQEELSVQNPNKLEHIWEDSLTITRDKNGNITRITRYYRTEGGGMTIVIEPDTMQNSLRISKVLIGD